MERPSTSKSRGICRYYTTPRGCFAGKMCKFLHGENEKYTPFDQNKICNFYRAGYCRRGADCWFRHVDDSNRRESASDEDLHCSVCYEKPVTYALLIGCSHVFCLQCIRRWRGSFNKSEDVVSSETAKSCPYCRVSSKFVIPSSQFFPEGHPRKAEIIAQYKASMSRVPCCYFQKSPPTNRHCPFGRDCFYQHMNDDNTPHIFTGGVEENMNARTFHWPAQTNLDDINATLVALRSSLPALLGIDPDGGGLLPADTDRILNLAEDMLQDLTALHQDMYGREEPGVRGESAYIIAEDPPAETSQEHEIAAEPYHLQEPNVPSTPPLHSFDLSGLVTALDTSSLTVTNSSDDPTLPLSLATNANRPEPDQRDNPTRPPVTNISRRHGGSLRQQVQMDAEVIPPVDIPSGEITRREAEEASLPATEVDSGATATLISEAFGEPSARSTPVYHNPNPPFATDGRGRVVWSNRGGRDTQSGQSARPPLARKARTDGPEGASSPLASPQTGGDHATGDTVTETPAALARTTSVPSLDKLGMTGSEDAGVGISSDESHDRSDSGEEQDMTLAGSPPGRYRGSFFGRMLGMFSS